MDDVEFIQLNNDQLLDIEKKNRMEISRDNEYSFLYPSLDDENFNEKIAQRQEFYDTRYEKPDSEEKGKTNTEKLEEISDKLCNAELEFSPHQMFVRNFLSFHTPYNGLLLYHGLGSGKTCSAIGIAEEMRSYLKQMGINKKILVIASPNVQNNFMIQLFDERKLQLVDGLWNIKSCVGSIFLREINPMSMKGIPREKVISQVKQIIKNAYHFIGYIEFANFITKVSTINSDMSQSNKDKLVKKKLTREFRNRLIIIDEIHNIRMTDDNANKKVAVEFMKLVKNVQKMRLLFLSATPMYNSYKEIVWLLNILNINDNRSSFSIKDIFEQDGSFKKNEHGEEVGKELLIRKSTGYISFVRGENPYTYPFRLWPSDFADKRNTIDNKKYKPNVQLNGLKLYTKLEHVSIFLCETGDIQHDGYRYVIEQIKRASVKDTEQQLTTFENMESFGYTTLQKPLEALNIVYPHIKLGSDEIFDAKELIGKVGLNRVMKFKETPHHYKGEFEYKSEYKDIFLPKNIGRFSGKISNICESVNNSEGVILIFSQYIDGGVIPVALALESMGMRRAGHHSLFKEPQAEEIDAITFKTKSEVLKTGGKFSTASYVMITGDTSISPDNVADFKKCTNLDNINGEKVKVIIISLAGSEGLDFKFIRQVHVLEPWYNMNRIEQIIGRAVRTCSHKDLEFMKRNTQIFLYGSILLSSPKEEAADLYVYRHAETKAFQIGEVSRVLKENAVDCKLNLDQTLFTESVMNTTVKQRLSTTKSVIDYIVGDKPYSSTCDYMENCSYTCKPDTNKYDKIIQDTYGEKFVKLNNDRIIKRIKDLFKERFFYKKTDLLKEIKSNKYYPNPQIYSALNQLIEDKHEYITDIYDRMGRLINIADLYLFQPLEINDNYISVHNRIVPVDYKRQTIVFEKDKPNEKDETLTENDLMEIIIENYELTKLSESHVKTNDWYVSCGSTRDFLHKNKAIKITDREIDIFVIHHIIESLYLDKMILLLNYIENVKKHNDITRIIEEYIKRYSYTNEDKKCILFNHNNKETIIIFDNKKWVQGTNEDKLIFIKSIQKNMTFERLNKYIGFMGDHKKDYMVFKIKDTTKIKNKGARCDQLEKKESIEILNSITNDRYGIDEDFYKQDLCVLQELFLRKKEYNKEKNMRWFLNPIEFLIYSKNDKLKK